MGKTDVAHGIMQPGRGARRCPDGKMVMFSLFVKGWERAKMYTLGVQGADQWRVNSLDQGLLKLYDRLVDDISVGRSLPVIECVSILHNRSHSNVV